MARIEQAPRLQTQILREVRRVRREEVGSRVIYKPHLYDISDQELFGAALTLAREPLAPLLELSYQADQDAGKLTKRALYVVSHINSICQEQAAVLQDLDSQTRQRFDAILAQTLVTQRRSLEGLQGWLTREGYIEKRDINSDGSLHAERLEKLLFFQNNPHLLDALKKKGQREEPEPENVEQERGERTVAGISRFWQKIPGLIKNHLPQIVVRGVAAVVIGAFAYYVIKGEPIRAAGTIPEPATSTPVGTLPLPPTETSTSTATKTATRTATATATDTATATSTATKTATSTATATDTATATGTPTPPPTETPRPPEPPTQPAASATPKAIQTPEATVKPAGVVTPRPAPTLPPSPAPTPELRPVPPTPIPSTREAEQLADALQKIPEVPKALADRLTAVANQASPPIIAAAQTAIEDFQQKESAVSPELIVRNVIAAMEATLVEISARADLKDRPEEQKKVLSYHVLTNIAQATGRFEGVSQQGQIAVAALAAQGGQFDIATLDDALYVFKKFQGVDDPHVWTVLVTGAFTYRMNLILEEGTEEEIKALEDPEIREAMYDAIVEELRLEQGLITTDEGNTRWIRGNGFYSIWKDSV